MTKLTKLTSALLGYLEGIVQAQNVQPITAPCHPASDIPHYCGEAFQFHLGRCGGAAVTAIMIHIEKLFTRVNRYTSQKSRFLANKEGATNTDLYAFSADEFDLYKQFLIEAADRIYKFFLPYTKRLPFKGYLFNEGVDITVYSTEATAKSTAHPANKFIRIDEPAHDGKLYQAIQNVPADTDITDTDYWRVVSELYDTKHKVVYFLDTIIPPNAILDCLQAVENYLYAFVLYRWYTMANIKDEADNWMVALDASESDIRSALVVRSGPITRKPSPW